MYLKKLVLINFKNIAQAEITLSERLNCFVGDNGAGKTNVLDAVYYLSMSKSALTMTDGQSVRHGEDFFVVEGTLCRRFGLERYGQLLVPAPQWQGVENLTVRSMTVWPTMWAAFPS